jgi:methylmalonyl-CoA mutase N-terminal domain/subunit
MQVVAHEHGALTSLDALEGSSKAASLEGIVRDRLRNELNRMDEAGGAIEALRSGYIAGRIDEGRGTRQRQLERGERAMVGHNVYEAPDLRDLFGGRSAGEVQFDEVERDALDRLSRHKARRDGAATTAALVKVAKAAAGTDNLLPPTIEALKAGATTQEIVEATREGFAR